MRTHGVRLFLKVLRPQAVAALHERHRLLRAAGLPVPRSLGVERRRTARAGGAVRRDPAHPAARGGQPGARRCRARSTCWTGCPRRLCDLPHRRSWTDDGRPLRRACRRQRSRRRRAEPPTWPDGCAARHRRRSGGRAGARRPLRDPAAARRRARDRAARRRHGRSRAPRGRPGVPARARRRPRAARARRTRATTLGAAVRVAARLRARGRPAPTCGRASRVSCVSLATGPHRVQQDDWARPRPAPARPRASGGWTAPTGRDRPTRRPSRPAGSARGGDRPHAAARRPRPRPRLAARPRRRPGAGRRAARRRRGPPRGGHPRRRPARGAEGGLAGGEARLARGAAGGAGAGARRWPPRSRRPRPRRPRPTTALRAAHLAVPNVVLDGVPAGRRAGLRRARAASVRCRRTTSRSRTTSTSARRSARSTPSAARRSAAAASPSSPAGARCSSSRWSTCRWPAAVEAGFTPVIAPALVRPEAMEGTGFLGAHADEVYRLADDDLYLVGTSEVPLAAYHSGEVLDELPLRYAGFSSCFRREAGSHGKDTRGIIRVHQFDKVEMFSYVDPARGRAASTCGCWRTRWSFLSPARAAVPRDRRRRRRSRLVGGPQVRLRGVAAVAGALARADLDEQLHRLPGPPARHPLARRGRAARRSPRSTARSARSAAPSPCCSRCTSAPTARCTSPRRCGPYLAGRDGAAAPVSGRAPPAGRDRPRRHARAHRRQRSSDRTREVARAGRGGRRAVRHGDRPPAALDGAGRRRTTGHHGLAVCANGALVYDLHTERVVRDFLHRRRDGADVVEALRARRARASPSPSRRAATAGSAASRPTCPRWDNGEVARRAGRGAGRAGGVVKLLARVRGAALATTCSPRPRDGPRRAAPSARTPRGDGLLEISAAGVVQGLRAGGRWPTSGASTRARRHRLRRHAQRPADAGLGRPRRSAWPTPTPTCSPPSTR